MVETKANPHTGQTELFYPGALHFFATLEIPTGDIAQVDLAIAPIPNHVVSFHQEISVFAGLTREVPRYDLHIGPMALSKRALYGFYGFPLDGWNGNLLQQNQRLEADLKYIGDEDDLRVFRLNHAHPGHDWYFGCSGAAIVDKDGRLVGIVVGGDEANNCIFGVNPNIYIDAMAALLAEDEAL